MQFGVWIMKREQNKRDQEKHDIEMKILRNKLKESSDDAT
jgi:hypothetical protein